MGQEEFEQRELGPGQVDRPGPAAYLTSGGVQPQVREAQRAARRDPGGGVAPRQGPQPGP